MNLPCHFWRSLLRRTSVSLAVALAASFTFVFAGVESAAAANGDVVGQAKLSDTTGGIVGPLSDGAHFGSGAVTLGDLDGDGDVEIAIGEPDQLVAAEQSGAVAILSLDSAGSSVGQVVIAEGAGGFTGVLDPGDRFGSGVALLGDLDGDGVYDIAVGAPGDDDGATDAGAVWILFLNANGTVKSHAKISRTQGGIGSAISQGDAFGFAVAGLGDVNGDGLPDLAVGMPGDDGGTPPFTTVADEAGRAFVLLLEADGSVRSAPSFSFGVDTYTFDTTYAYGQRLGAALAGIGDLDHDGVPDLLVGSPLDGVPTVATVVQNFNDCLQVLTLEACETLLLGALPNAYASYGSFRVVLLTRAGLPKASVLHGDQGGLGGALDVDDAFGSSLTPLGDIDGDGVQDVLVGAPGDDDGGAGRGAAWIVRLNADGTAKSTKKLSATSGGFGGTLDDGDAFGSAAAGLGDFDTDGAVEAVVGASGDDDAGGDRGAIWLLSLEGSAPVCGNAVRDPLEECDDGGTSSGDGCAASCEVEDDIFLSGTAVGGSAQLTVDGVVVSVVTTVGQSAAQVAAALAAAITANPTLAAKGTSAVSVGSTLYTTGTINGFASSDAGILISPSGSALAASKISATAGGFGGALSNFDRLGGALAPVGDLDSDGVIDLAVGADGDDDGGSGRGAVWILFRNPDGSVKSEQKISATSGAFAGVLDDLDGFGSALTALGDFDGDGFTDLAVGAPGDDDGGSGRGAVWILLLEADGTVKSSQKISATAGGFAGALADGARFGASLAAIGDVDADGVGDLVVGAPGSDAAAGASWVLRMERDGTVKAAVEFDTDGLFGNYVLSAGDELGASVARIGDVNGDGVPDFLVGAPGDDDGGTDRGAAYVMLLQSNGGLWAPWKISQTEGGFSSTLANGDRFGSSVASLGDVDADGAADFAIGAASAAQGGVASGVVWVLLADSNSVPGAVLFAQRIDTQTGALAGALDASDRFGGALAAVGDLDGDGGTDLFVGAIDDDDGGSNRGAVWTLSLATVPAACGDAVLDPGEACDDANNLIGDGCSATCSVEDQLFVSGTGQGGSIEIVVDGVLISITTFAGESAADVAQALADAINANATLQLRGTTAIADGNVLITSGSIGTATSFDEGLYVRPRPAALQGFTRLSPVVGGYGGATLHPESIGAPGDHDGDGHLDVIAGDTGTSQFLFMGSDGTVMAQQPIPYGSAIAALGDFDGDGVGDLAVGDPTDDDGVQNAGALWLLFERQDGTVRATAKISSTQGGFGGVLDPNDAFGTAVAPLGDLDGNGIDDVAVGATDQAVWIVFLEADGTARHWQRIAAGTGGFTGTLDVGDNFGRALAAIGDLDGDGIAELAVGATGDDDGGVTDSGAVWILFLDPDGTVRTAQKISLMDGDFTGTLKQSAAFGTSLAAMGDVDGDGTPDLAVGEPNDNDGGVQTGAIWVLLLRPDGAVASHQKFSNYEGAFAASLQNNDRFGTRLAAIGDLDEDGIGDLAVSAPGDEDGGAIYFLSMDVLPLVCGDGSIGPLEACDDGNAQSGDGCAATCEDEQPLKIFGTAAGGDVTVTVDGIELVVPTSFGASAAAIAADVEAAIDASAALQLVGASAAHVAHIVWVEGTVNDVLSNDPGLVVSFDPGRVLAEQKIDRLEGGLTGPLDPADAFGSCTGFLGDLDGDGVGDIAVGAPGDDDGGTDRGAVYVLLLNPDGTVKTESKLSSTNFTLLANGDALGACVAGIGDLDGDGVPDMAVGATGEDDGGTDRGAVWIVFLNANGTMKSRQKISPSSGSFVGTLSNGAAFGRGLAALGDLDGDGIPDLAAGSPLSAGGGTARGSAWILFLRRTGFVRETVELSGSALGLGLADGDHYGMAMASPGDIDGDGVAELAVAAPGTDDVSLGADIGMVHLLRLNSDGSVHGTSRFEAGTRGLVLEVDAGEELGLGLAAIGDIDANGVPDLAIGADKDWDGGAMGAENGAVYVALLAADGSLVGRKKLSLELGDLAPFDPGSHFGASLVALRNAGEPPRLAVAAPLDDSGIPASAYGSVDLLTIDAAVPVCGDGALDTLEECDDGGNAAGDGCSATCTIETALAVWGTATGGVISFTVDGVTVMVTTSAAQTAQQVAAAIAAAIDANATLAARGVTAVASDRQVSAGGALKSSTNTDAGLIVDYSPGLVIEERRIADLGSANEDAGTALVFLGDIDRDGIGDIAIGRPGVSSDTGQVDVLLLNANGSVKTTRIIKQGQGGFTGTLATGDHFGVALTPLGDIDGDGVPDLAVGASMDDTGFTDEGAVWILRLTSTGQVKAQQKLARNTGGFGTTGVGLGSDHIGIGLAGLGDLDGDGRPELAVLAENDDASANNAGAIHLVSLNTDGTVFTRVKITPTSAGAADANGYGFRGGLTRVGDLDGDGIADLAVGNTQDDDGGSNAGAVLVLLLDANGTVHGHYKLSAASGLLAGELNAGDHFGRGLSALGDFDGDGRFDLAVGAEWDGDDGPTKGAVYLLALESDGSVGALQKISETRGGFGGTMALDQTGAIDGDHFGTSLAGMGVRLGAFPRLAVGAPGFESSTSARDKGAAWILTLDGVPPVCGNGFLEPVEECDDGNLQEGDGCASICQTQDVLQLFGTAQGGSVQITVDGVVLNVTTTNGESVTAVMAALAAAVNGNSTLQFLGTTASHWNGTLYVNGTLSAFSVSDGGLSQSGASVPALPLVAWLVLVAGLGVQAARRLQRARVQAAR